MGEISLAQFIREAHRRGEFGVVALYVVGAWIVLQAADLAFPGLGIPESAIRYVWIGAILGLPVAMVFGWRFDITTQGIKRTPTTPGETTDLSLRTHDYIVLLVLSTASIAIVFLLGQEIVATQGVPVDKVVELPEFDPPKNSIAVLPFDNLSNDPEQEYFVAGMHDALIGELARINDLIVISRTSTLRYQETVLSVLEIARELNVAMIVEGSVFKSGDRIRIQIQLIGAQPERHLLAQSYERALSGVLMLQREVTQDIAEKIKVKLTPQEQSRLAKAQKVNPEAYESYLRGHFFANQFTPDSFAKAVTYFEQAIELEPEDPLAYAGLASAYSMIAAGHGNIPASVAYPRSRQAADKALQLDGTLAEAHLAYGMVSLHHDWNWSEAERRFRRAIEINPNLANAHLKLALSLTALLQFDEAIRENYIAAQLDPLTPIVLADTAVRHFAARQYDRAIAQANKALELNPDFAPALWILGEAYLRTGLHRQAVEAHQKASELGGPIFLFELAHTYAAIGDVSKARTILDQADENTRRRFALSVAVVLAELGETDQAIASLELAVQERSPWIEWIRIFPAFDSLRSDPRYVDIIQRLNFPDPDESAEGPR